MTVQPSTVNRKELGAQEWHYALFLQYGLDPPDLPNHCDGCTAKLSIYHALDCKRGGLVTARHNDLRDRVADLSRNGFTPSNVRDNPLIFAGGSVKKPKANPASTTGSTDRYNSPPSEAMGHKVELLISDLWQNGTDSVHELRVVNNDAKYHSVKPPDKCLQESERAKKRMYLEACLNQSRHFSPFVASVDGFLSIYETATLKRRAICLATKCRKPYSRTCG